jgi:histidinol-phosphate aminotransferase
MFKSKLFGITCTSYAELLMIGQPIRKTKGLSVKVPSDILSLTPYQPGKPIDEVKREYGLTQVIKLASNENALGASPDVRTALQNSLGDISLYPDAAAFEMGGAFAKLVGRPPAQIGLGNGSNELIDLLIRLYCQPGDAILTSELAFIAYRISAQAAQVKTITTPLTPEGCFDLTAMAQVLKTEPKIRLVFIANPNNPTGTYVGKSELNEFLEECQKHEILVVLDEAYFEYVRAPDYISGLELQKKFPQVIVLRTMSKAYGLAGLRVGFAIGEESTISLLHRIRNPFNVNSLAQIAVVAALKDQKHVHRSVQLAHQGLDRMTQAVAKSELPYFKSEANFLLVDCQVDSEKVFISLLKKGVIVRPLKNYGLMSHLRISIGREEENEILLRSLAEVLGRKIEC